MRQVTHWIPVDLLGCCLANMFGTTCLGQDAPAAIAKDTGQFGARSLKVELAQERSGRHGCVGDFRIWVGFWRTDGRTRSHETPAIFRIPQKQYYCTSMTSKVWVYTQGCCLLLESTKVSSLYPSRGCCAVPDSAKCFQDQRPLRVTWRISLSAHIHGIKAGVLGYMGPRRSKKWLVLTDLLFSRASVNTDSQKAIMVTQTCPCSGACHSRNQGWKPSFSYVLAVRGCRCSCTCSMSSEPSPPFLQILHRDRRSIVPKKKAKRKTCKFLFKRPNDRVIALKDGQMQIWRAIAITVCGPSILPAHD